MGGIMPKMRAVQVSRPGGPLETVDREIPVAGPGFVRVRVEACGICHSDSLTKEGLWPGIEYPRVPGHEIAGVVDAVGADVPAWKPGDRVGIGWHGGHCGYCEPCRRGDFLLCRIAARIPGITHDGGYQDYVSMPSGALARIPDGLSAAEAAPLMCAGVTTFNSLRHRGPGDRRQASRGRRSARSPAGARGSSHRGTPLDRRLALRPVHRLGRHDGLRRPYGSALDERDLPARRGGAGLRPHDERQG